MWAPLQPLEEEGGPASEPRDKAGRWPAQGQSPVVVLLGGLGLDAWGQERQGGSFPPQAGQGRTAGPAAEWPQKQQVWMRELTDRLIRPVTPATLPSPPCRPPCSSLSLLWLTLGAAPHQGLRVQLRPGWDRPAWPSAASLVSAIIQHRPRRDMGTCRRRFPQVPDLSRSLPRPPQGNSSHQSPEEGWGQWGLWGHPVLPASPPTPELQDAR